MQSLTVDAVLTWINLAADEIERRKAYLNDLDAPIGDSDHGANMARGFSAVKAKLAGQRQADIGALFKVVAMTLLSTVGGASGPLYATFFLQAATKSAGKTELDLAGWTACLEAALTGVAQRGKAVLGDKTMIDALAPAVEALKRADGEPLGEALTEFRQSRRGGDDGDHPARRAQGARQLPRRAQRRPSGSRRNLDASAVESADRNCAVMTERKGGVALVLVSHSKALAEGVAALARQMVGDGVTIICAAGAGEDGSELGIDTTRVLEAIIAADNRAGTVVFMDLGSAILSTEMALDLAEPQIKGRVLLSSAPFVEGAVTAAVASAAGAPREALVAEASRALAPKVAQLGATGDLGAGKRAGRSGPRRGSTVRRRRRAGRRREATIRDPPVCTRGRPVRSRRSRAASAPTSASATATTAKGPQTPGA